MGMELNSGKGCGMTEYIKNWEGLAGETIEKAARSSDQIYLTLESGKRAILCLIFNRPDVRFGDESDMRDWDMEAAGWQEAFTMGQGRYCDD